MLLLNFLISKFFKSINFYLIIKMKIMKTMINLSKIQTKRILSEN